LHGGDAPEHPAICAAPCCRTCPGALPWAWHSSPNIFATAVESSF
jgi:hypothetical protein